MYVLGVNAYHGDVSACLLLSGRLIAAVEEERLCRVKHWAGFPSEAIRCCLAIGGIELQDVQCIAVNSDPRANLVRKLSFAIRQPQPLGLLLERVKNQAERAAVEEELKKAFPEQRFGGLVKRVEHHLAHMASAYHASPFKQAVVVSVDGFGDFSSAAWGVARGRHIQAEGRVYFPHSLGLFYQTLTQYLGFPHYGDEYKVMGLAPYGKPSYMDQMRKIVHVDDDGGYRLGLDYFRHHKEKIDYQWSSGSPVVGRLFSPALEDLLGPARDSCAPLEGRHRDIAHSVQVMYEEAFFHLLNRLHEKYGLEDVALAGGCAMNSVANGKVRRRTPFKRLYVQPAAGDAGGAIGAALQAAYDLTGGNIQGRMEHAYWGPEFSNETIGDLLAGKATKRSGHELLIERVDDEDALYRSTAGAIVQGQVVGWFQGRMEWGPRALGNRSILCDPRRADMKEILNNKIKRRESFRPFAPSVLREDVSDWFEEDDDVPFMMKVFQIREEKRALIPAVTHVDGSGRLQTVYRHTNPRYYRLIQAFRDETGVPMVLNTSFNENEPVVCRPEEALDCFLRTDMDVLVMGNWLVRRQDRSSPSGPVVRLYSSA